MKYDEAKKEEIRLRFQQDFLPKYGNLWRSMVEQQALVEDPPVQPVISIQESESDHPVTTTTKPMNFLDAIQSGTVTKFDVLTNHGDSCNCDGCEEPILEWETDIAATYRDTNNVDDENDNNSDDSENDDSTVSYATPLTHEDESRSNESVKSVEDATTPLPSDLQDRFGRISFGNIDMQSQDTHNGSDKSDVSQLELAEENLSIASKAKDGKTHMENSLSNDDESSNRFDSANDASLNSSGSSAVHFDMSHIVHSPESDSNKASPVHNQFSTPQSSSNSQDQFFSPESNIRLSPKESGENENKDVSIDSASESSMSAGFHVDLSHVLQSPVNLQGQAPSAMAHASKSITDAVSETKQAPLVSTEPFFSPASKSSLTAGHDAYLSASPSLTDEEQLQEERADKSEISNRDHNTSVIIDLVDSDSDSDSDFDTHIAAVDRLRTPYNSTIPRSRSSGKSISVILDTSDELDSIAEDRFSSPSHEIARKSLGNKNSSVFLDTSDEIDSPDEALPSSTRYPATHESVDDESDTENEWGGSDSSEASFDSPSESEEEMQKTKASTSPRRWQDENINPNMGTTKTTNKKIMSKAHFKKNREALTAQCFDEMNAAAFNGRLAGVDVQWSTRLRTRAGLTRLKKKVKDFTPGSRPEHLASIELSTKVLDDPARLQSTLLHEMVHAAAWIIDGVSKPPHGASFKKWARIAMNRIPDVKVTTTHDYKIQYKYAWSCVKPGCSFLVQRHSRSVDVSRHCCGRCKSRLVEVNVPSRSNRLNLDKTPKKRVPPSGYNLFVKEKSKNVRSKMEMAQRARGISNPKVSQSEVMKECARLWKEHKAIQVTAD